MQLQKVMWAAQTVVALTIPATALAASPEQVGTLAQAQGGVQLFTNPSKALPAEVKPGEVRARFEGEHYVVREARPGDRLENGNILRTAPGAKAWVIFANGDQYHVGPGTAYRVNWERKDRGTEVQLMYGKLRGVVAKKGPRSKLFIRTRSATMGVRGTDFFVAEDSQGGTEVSVIRGSVEVKPATASAKPTLVGEGDSVSVQVPAFQAESIIVLRRTTQEDLRAILKTSEIAPDAKAAPVAPEVAREIAALEKKAAENTLQDIQAHDPELFAKISQAGPVADPARINQQSVEKLLRTAPPAPARRKPYKTELEDLEREAYEKYFKSVE